jgi:hypothetical protein
LTDKRSTACGAGRENDFSYFPSMAEKGDWQAAFPSGDGGCCSQGMNRRRIVSRERGEVEQRAVDTLALQQDLPVAEFGFKSPQKL